MKGQCDLYVLKSKEPEKRKPQKIRLLFCFHHIYITHCIILHNVLCKHVIISVRNKNRRSSTSHLP